MVSGRLTAFNSYPVANVKVSAKKSKATVLTDSAGVFKIICQKKDRITIEAEGFAKAVRSVKSGDQLTINLILLQGKKNQDRILSYGYLNPDDLAFGLNNLSSENTDYSKYSDVFDLISGKIPGVRVVSNRGTKRILVGGPSSMSLSNYALYVVDGVIWNDISSLHPTNIESVAVLKNAAAAAYGAKGTNGVILITLKQGDSK